MNTSPLRPANARAAFLPGWKLTLLALAIGLLPAVIEVITRLPGSEFLSGPLPVLQGLGMVTLLLCILLAPLSVLLFGAVALFSHRRRYLAAKVILLFLLAAGTSFVSMRLASRFERRTMHYVARRGEPLIQAISEYKRDMGTYPPDLAALCPRWIPAPPSTGVAVYAPFKYSLPSAHDWLPRSYQLSAVRREPFLEFRQLIYWPEEDYEGRRLHAYVEPIGRWAYFNFD